MTKNISIIIPAYNEAETIKSVILSLQQELNEVDLKNYEVVVINDGSTDQTKDVISKINGIQIINHPYNLGYGASIKTGVKSSKYDWLAIIDADGTYPVEDFSKLIKYCDNYDMIVGSRTGNNINIPFLRRPGKKIVGWLAIFLTNKKIPDLNSGMRIFRKSIALEFFHLFPSRFSLTTTITLACLTNDYLVKYVPINYHKRQGKSSIKATDFFSFLALVVKVVMYFNPLKFFVTPGLTLMLIGGLAGISTMIIGKNITDSSVILLITGFQIIFIGLVADLIVRSRK